MIFWSIINLNISYADDTAVNSFGGNLICEKETRISLKKETLIFTQLENSMRVDVYFEFYNPDDARDLKVGFVTPGISAPELPEGGNPNLENFIAIVNDEIVKFNISKLENTDFKVTKQDYFNYDYIYYFDVRFKKGINTIKHSYNYGPIISTGGSLGTLDYFYKLTTGKNWANETIEDFELIINKTGLFDVPLYLDRNPTNNWEVKGFGKTQEEIDKSKLDNSKLNINLKSGYLYLHKTNFKPEHDIQISRYNPIDNFDILKTIYWSSMNGDYGLDKLDKEDYRIARNAIFAIYGYKFNDIDMLNYFSKYFWYIPDPNITNSVDIFDQNYKNLFNRIVQLEKEYKTP